MYAWNTMLEIKYTPIKIKKKKKKNTCIQITLPHVSPDHFVYNDAPPTDILSPCFIFLYDAIIGWIMFPSKIPALKS